MSSNGHQSAYDTVKAMVLKRVAAGEIDPQGPAEVVRRQIASVVRDYQKGAHLGDGVVALTDPEGMVERIVTAVCDYGPLTELLDRGDVEEIMIHGGHLSYVTADGRSHFPTATVSEAEYRQYIERLLQAAGADRQLDASHTMTSVGLAGGGRLAVKIPPTADRLTVCICKPVLVRPSLAEMVEQGTMTAAAGGLLWALMQVRSRVVIAGSHGAGKTTLANALLAAIPPDQVIRVNEQTRELSVPLLKGSYCQANDDRPGQSLRDLIKADLLFRPDWLVVGEVRGGEAADLLSPLNAGTGFLTTCHANRAEDAIDKLSTCATFADLRMEEARITKLFATAIDFVVFVDGDEAARRRQPGARRQVMEIAWISPGLVAGQVVAEPILVREALGRPLVWTGAQPRPTVVARIERGLEGRGSLTALLDGHLTVGGLR